MLSENVKDIKGYEGKYAITNDGRVYSHSRVMNNPRSESGSLIKGRWLKATINKNGYLRIGLSSNCSKRTINVHRLVAEAFIPNPENKPQVNHIDGDKSNNHVSNLEWATNQENIIHAMSIGLITNEHTIGERNPAAKLTEEQVLEIRASSDCSRVEAAKHGVSKTTIKDIRKRKIWKHL